MRVWEGLGMFRRVWEDMGGFGRFWKDLGGFGRVWDDLGRFEGGLGGLGWEGLVGFGTV